MSTQQIDQIFQRPEGFMTGPEITTEEETSFLPYWQQIWGHGLCDW